MLAGASPLRPGMGHRERHGPPVLPAPPGDGAPGGTRLPSAPRSALGWGTRRDPVLPSALLQVRGLARDVLSVLCWAVSQEEQQEPGRGQLAQPFTCPPRATAPPSSHSPLTCSPRPGSRSCSARGTGPKAWGVDLQGRAGCSGIPGRTPLPHPRPCGAPRGGCSVTGAFMQCTSFPKHFRLLYRGQQRLRRGHGAGTGLPASSPGPRSFSVAGFFAVTPGQAPPNSPGRC